jgi:hypothetical protein
MNGGKEEMNRLLVGKQERTTTRKTKTEVGE